jgi:hypothetical protein
MTDTLHKDVCTVIISRVSIHKIRHISSRICREGQNTHSVFNNFFFENRAVFEITWKNLVEPDRPQMKL